MNYTMRIKFVNNNWEEVRAKQPISNINEPKLSTDLMF